MAGVIPKVTIDGSGRGGTVTYDEGDGRQLAGYWEFGGDDVVACVNCGTVDAWAHHAWALPRRSAILHAIASEVVRQKAPSCVADIDEASGTILLRQSGFAAEEAQTALRSDSVARSVAGIDASATRSAAAQWMRRLSATRAKLGLVVLAAALLLGTGVWLKGTLFSITPGKGTAIGDTVRTDRHVVTLIETLEPYVPTLNRNHGDDRYSVSLLLVPLDGTAPRLIPVRRGLPPGATSTARIFGSDGRVLWFDAGGLGALELDRLELRPEAELASVSLRDLPRPWGVWPMAPRVEQLLDGEAYTGTGYLQPALVRSGTDAPVLRFTDPPGGLLLYTSQSGSQGTAVVARIDANGRPLWSVDTGISRHGLRQILPGEHSTALVGTRPPVPDQVSEPLLVLVDHSTGRVATHSLWQ